MTNTAWDIDFENYPENGSLLEKLKFIASFAVFASSSHNTQPWAFGYDELKQEIYIVPDWERLLSASDKDKREIYVSLGCAVGQLKSAANYYGWKVASDVKLEGRELGFIKLSLSEGYAPSEQEKTAFLSSKLRRNYDGAHKKQKLPVELLEYSEILAKEFSALEIKITQERGVIGKIAELVEKADRVIFADKAFTTELVEWLRDVTSDRQDGILVSALGMPRSVRRFAGRILLNLKKKDIPEMTKDDRERTGASAGIGVVASKRENIASMIAVGEYYQKLALYAASLGVMFGARAVLVETGVYYKALQTAMKIKGRPGMMFRAGFPLYPQTHKTPRYKAEQRVAVRAGSEFKVISVNRPTVFKLSKSLSLPMLLETLPKDTKVDAVSYYEHWMSDLYGIKHPDGDVRNKAWRKKLENWLDTKSERDGVWVYNPHKSSLAHMPEEREFYQIITASNSRKISARAQKNLQKLCFGICGLSGSGSEVALTIAMSGAKYLKLADFDYVSPKNLNRMEGRVGENKTWEFARRLWGHNPFLDLTLFTAGVNESNIDQFFEGLDMVIEQTDSVSKFLVRAKAKKTGIPVVQITDMPDPIVDIETRGDADFGGRAEAAKIDRLSMERIDSIEESTGYLPILMDPDKVPTESFQNFKDILDGKVNTYSQVFFGAQAGGGVFGRLLVAFAEGKLSDFPKSYVIKTSPKEETGHERAFGNFLMAYNRKFGLKRFNKFYDKYKNGKEKI